MSPLEVDLKTYAPKNVETIALMQESYVLPHFTTEDAWTIGTSLRSRILEHPKPVVISICLANSSQIIFQAVNHSGTIPDNSVWIARKVKTALRFGVPSYSMHVKFDGDEHAFAAKYGLSPDKASTYAIHGGAVPIRVKGVEGIVAVITVSGLKQDQDHALVVEALHIFKKKLDL